MKISHGSIHNFLHKIATKPCTPAGGCTAALCAASAAALIEMVARHTINNSDKSKGVVEYMEEVAKLSSIYRQNFLNDMDRDVQAYKDVIEAQKNEEDADEHHKTSITIPLQMANRVLDMINIIEKIIKDGSKVLLTDSVAALLIAKATLKSLIYHIRFNLIYIEDKDFVDEIVNKLKLLEM